MKRGPTFILIVYFCVVAFAYWQVDILWSSTETISLENLDLYTLYYPIISYAIECLKVWHIPLWNPYQALGVPFAASAYYGMFYPLNFIYFILPVHIALGASTALHIAMAGLFTYIFLYHGLKISLQSALIGATVFMLSGAFTSEVAHPNDLNAMVWLPLILFHVENIFQTRKPLWGVLLGVTLGLQVLTMSFQTVIFSGY
ncbi:MAG: YfhO family protein, partial [Thermodesulfobacteriota bacterium]